MMTTTVKFWRLQEVEVPVCDGKTVNDVKQAFKDIRDGNADGLFDFDDLLDWDSEEICNEDYSAMHVYYTIKTDGKQVDGSRSGQFGTLNYIDGRCDHWHFRD